MSFISTLSDFADVFPKVITNEWIQSMPRRALTEEEQALPYAHYYDKEMAAVPQALLDIVNAGPIDPKMALPREYRDMLLRPGYLKAETGYCLMPDGSGFAATKVFMPGVTPEMLDWWFNWHPLVGLRYAIWCPVAHKDSSAQNPAGHKDSSGVPLHTRNYGKVHYPVEGFDLKGAERIEIAFHAPEDLKLDMSQFHAPNIDSLFAASVSKKIGPVRIPVNVFMHCVRAVEGGVEYRSRYWVGCVVNKNGEIVQSKLPLPKKLIEQLARNNCAHSLIEYHNLASILPTLYAGQGGKIE
ncbi:MAG: hypothetical protein R3Y06_06580 [Faecalibacterium sp.]